MRSGCLQADCSSELSLPLVEGPKGFGCQLKGGANVQTVQSSHADAGTMAAGQFYAGIPNGFWQVDLKPKSTCEIALQFRLHASCLGSRNLLPENMLRHGVHPFRAVEGTEPDARFRGHPTLGLLGVPVGQVE